MMDFIDQNTFALAVSGVIICATWIVFLLKRNR